MKQLNESDSMLLSSMALHNHLLHANNDNNHRKIEKSYDDNKSDIIKNPLKHGLSMNNKTKN